MLAIQCTDPALVKIYMKLAEVMNANYTTQVDARSRPNESANFLQVRYKLQACIHDF